MAKPAMVASRAVPESRKLANPQIVKASKRLQCVPFARELADVSIRGNASTWWAQAAGEYERRARPEVGSVLVLDGYRRGRGHVAVVTRVVNDREIVISHANWLNNGRIHLDEPVKDVSEANDWSAVRVWYTPKDQWGTRVYDVRGFIMPPSPPTAVTEEQARVEGVLAEFGVKRR